VPLYGGGMPRPALLAHAEKGPASVPSETRRRWSLTYGDRIDDVFARLDADAASAEEIAPGVPRAELEHSVEFEDAMTAEDFLLRRTKLHLLLEDKGREQIQNWFAKV